MSMENLSVIERAERLVQLLDKVIIAAKMLNYNITLNSGVVWFEKNDDEVIGAYYRNRSEKFILYFEGERKFETLEELEKELIKLL